MKIRISKQNNNLLRVTFPDGTYILVYGNHGEGCEIQSGSKIRDSVNSQDNFSEKEFVLGE